MEVGRTKRDVDVDRDDAIATRTSEKLVGKIAEVVESICMSAAGRATIGSLQMVHTATLLTTGTPDTTVRSVHVVRKCESMDES